MSDAGPNRDDDEARLHDYAVALADAVDAALGPWVWRCVEFRCADAGLTLSDDARAATSAAAAACTSEIGGRVRSLLLCDIDEQAGTPLTVLRDAVGYPTAVLDGLGVPDVARDDFARRSFPGDRYDLTPASFAEIDESLHEPGLAWGAAKAFVHRRRRGG